MLMKDRSDSRTIRRRTIRRGRRSLFFWLAPWLFLVPQFARSDQDRLTKEDRIELIRGLASEIAVAKIAMPRGKRGIMVNEKGKVNQAEANAEIRSNGAAVRAGMPVEITKITFKSDKIVFDLNGGGRTTKKWYQHIQIGVGGATQPIGPQPEQPGQQPGEPGQQPEQPGPQPGVPGQSPGQAGPQPGQQGGLPPGQHPDQPPGRPAGQGPDQQSGQAPSTMLVFGSYITLSFPGKVPQLNSQQVKQILGSVLDFERHAPTALYSPSVPPKFKEAIKKHEVLVGMDRDSVLSAKGPPDRKVREVKEGIEKEDWIYGLPPHSLFVTFDGDVVVSVRQY